MTNRAALETILDKTGVAYRACWQVLRGMKTLDTSPEFVKGLLDFQSTLAKAIFDLDDANRRLEKEREHLVTIKSRLKPNWFLQRVKRLGGYQEVVAEAIDMGKQLGDAFAWFFYHNDRDLLDKHLSHKPITDLTTGFGRDGELAFICNVKIQNGQLVLYHGITNILRNGDVSFVDLKTFRVSCLGEIKSKRVGENAAIITLHCVGSKERMPPFVVSSNPPTPTPHQSEMLEGTKERFQRQMQAMADTFKPYESKSNVNIEEDTYFPALVRIADNLSRKATAFEQCGDGLLLVGFRFDPSRTLYAKLKKGKMSPKRLKGLDEHAVKICDATQAGKPDNANSISIGLLGKGIIPGTVPLCWWPLHVDLVEKLLFQDIGVATIYNPVHLITKLRRMGYQVKIMENGRRHAVTKIIGEGQLELHGFEYFKNIIQWNLMREETILEMLGSIDRLVEVERLGPRARIDLNIRQEFGRPPVRLTGDGSPVVPMK